MHRTVLAIVAAIGSTVAATAPAASAADRCHHVRGDHVIARSAEAVVVERFGALRAGDGTRYAGLQHIVGCARATGRRRLITTLEDYDTAGADELSSLKLAGTRVAYVVLGHSKLGTTISIAGGDAVHPRRADRRPYFFGEDAIPSWSVTADGTVAWIVRDGVGHDVLQLRRPGGDLRTVDIGFGLDTLVLTRDALRWHHGGAARTLSLTPSPNACAGTPARAGTPEVDLTNNDRGLTACLRATGASLTLPRGAVAPTRFVDIATPYVAVTGDHSIVRLDLATGSIDSIPTVGQAYEVRVDEHGSLAWVDHPEPRTSTLWVRDAGGTRQFGRPAVGFSFLHLSRDGSTVRADGGTVITLSP